jgi:hypothetical protein
MTMATSIDDRWCGRQSPGQPGSVVRPRKHRVVVAWFPVSRLYRLQVGDAVTVSTDGASLPGKIAKVSVIADALPNEFQKAFAPHRRNTMARKEPTTPYGRTLAGGSGLGASNHWIAAGGA